MKLRKKKIPSIKLEPLFKKFHQKVRLLPKYMFAAPLRVIYPCAGYFIVQFDIIKSVIQEWRAN